MADIAMLVAEEYERRMKNSRINNEQIEFLSSFSVLVQEVKGSSSRIKMRFLGENEDKRVFVPQTQVALEAINGFSYGHLYVQQKRQMEKQKKMDTENSKGNENSNGKKKIHPVVIESKQERQSKVQNSSTK